MLGMVLRRTVVSSKIVGQGMASLVSPMRGLLVGAATWGALLVRSHLMSVR
jgi:hypothetical protein